MSQNGNQFVWDVASNHERAQGTIQGTGVSASWAGDWGPGQASGTVTVDPNGQAVRIDWSNGVVFQRAGSTRPSVVAGPSTIADVSGTWKGSSGLVYEIAQNGNQFGWDVASNHEHAQGTVQGGAVKASWAGDWGKGQATGQVTRDASGRGVRIDWSNGVVFQR
jgi:hypothetical protein